MNSPWDHLNVLCAVLSLILAFIEFYLEHFDPK